MGSGRPTAVLVVVVATLTTLSLAGQLLVRSQAVQASWFVTLAAGFDLDHEVNVPSWLNSPNHRFTQRFIKPQIRNPFN